MYVVRVMEERATKKDENHEAQTEASILCYLRTGRNVAEIIRAFQSQDVATSVRGRKTDLALSRERRRSHSLDKVVKPQESLWRYDVLSFKTGVIVCALKV